MSRTWIAYRAGRVLELEADARAVLAVPWDNPLYLNYAVAQLIVALIEQGAVDEALNLLREHGLAETTEPDGMLSALFYGFRGRLHRVCGRPREALADIERCRDIVLQAGFPGPPLSEWRLDAALAHLALDERDLAREIADEDVELSRAFGAPRELGMALRSSGLVEGGARGLELLAESADVLAGSEAVLDEAKSRVELGAALRRAGKRADAQDWLRKGLDLAARCGATAVAARARDELTAAGARPRREQISGPESLTASELRVARLAAEGRSNAEIAQSLFVTRRTVEFHLTNVYRKLEIDSRDALSSALRPQQP
jgi:DNA-binding CsgD family transcriptional regulator